MQGSPPPRRSRRPPQDGGRSFPLIPLLIGVVVLGFVIGAGLSIVAKHGSSDSSVAVAPTVAATIPAALAQPSPLDAPSPFASDTETPSPIPSHAAKHSPTPQPTLPATPSPTPVRTAKPVATPTPEPSHDAETTATPSAESAATAEAAAAAATSEPTETPSPSVQGASTPFAQLAGSVVRVFLTSLERGDRDTAIAELASPPRGPLPEEAVVDENTEIRSLEVHGTGDVVTVDVDLKGPSGTYGAHYSVQKTPTGAAQIVEHTVVKLSAGGSSQ